jgi:DME family drug/metabolite transporter
MDGQSYGRGVALVISAGLLWSAMILGLRMLENESTWAVLVWRSAGMVPVLALFIWWRSGSLIRAFRGMGWPLVLGSAALAVCFTSAIYAVQNTTAANAVFPLAVTPLISALLARLLLGEPIRRATWIAIAIAALGVFVMVAEGLSAGALLGNLAALLGAACFAIFTVSLRWARASDNLPGVLLGGIFSVALGLAGAQASGDAVLFDPGLVALALGLGALLLGLGLTLFAMGARSVPAAELSLLSMIEVLLSPIWVWLLLAETSSPMTFLGGAIVLVAIAYNALSGLGRARAPA